jgi:hypothetical protein
VNHCNAGIFEYLLYKRHTIHTNNENSQGSLDCNETTMAVPSEYFRSPGRRVVRTVLFRAAAVPTIYSTFVLVVAIHTSQGRLRRERTQRLAPKTSMFTASPARNRVGKVSLR